MGTVLFYARPKLSQWLVLVALVVVLVVMGAVVLARTTKTITGTAIWVVCKIAHNLFWENLE